MLLVAAVAAIGVMTLFPERGGVDHAFRWRLTGSGAHLVEDLLNVILFAPLGFALARLGLSPGRAVAFAALLSIAVELVQLHLVVGRFAELQDILANSCGGILGWALASVMSHRIDDQQDRSEARR